MTRSLTEHTPSPLLAAPTDLGSLRNPSLDHALRRENPSLAYLLGAWASLTETGTEHSGRICYASKDPAQVDLLRNKISSLLSYAPPALPVYINGALYHRIELRHETLANHIHTVTNNNNRIPWEHLGTQQECASFLRGVFDHGGWVFTGKTAGIGIGKKDGTDLLLDMTRVFVRLGLRPLIVENHTTSLKLRETSEWSRFAEVIGTSLESRKHDLRELCATPPFRQHFTIEDFQGVVACVQSGIDAPSDISRMTNVPPNTVRDWLYRGQMPPVVKRQMAIDESTKHLPQADVITYIYRELGGSPSLAREFAASLPLILAKDRIDRSTPNVSTIYGDDDKIRAALAPQPGADIFHPSRR